MLITISITKLKKTAEYVPSTSLITLVTSCAINKRKLPIMINVSGFITETCHGKACSWWLYCSVFPSHTCVYHGKAITIILLQTNRHSSPKPIKWQNVSSVALFRALTSFPSLVWGERRDEVILSKSNCGIIVFRALPSFPLLAWGEHRDEVILFILSSSKASGQLTRAKYMAVPGKNRTLFRCVFQLCYRVQSKLPLRAGLIRAT